MLVMKRVRSLLRSALRFTVRPPPGRLLGSSLSFNLGKVFAAMIRFECIVTVGLEDTSLGNGSPAPSPPISQVGCLLSGASDHHLPNSRLGVSMSENGKVVNRVLARKRVS